MIERGVEAGGRLTRGRGQRDIGGQQDVGRREGAGAGDGVFQLADISGPVVRLQGGDRFRGNPDSRHAVFPGDALEEILGQQRDVLQPLAQGRDLDFHDVQPVIKVLPEPPGGDFLSEVLVGGRHDPDIGGERLIRTDAGKRAVLQHA